MANYKSCFIIENNEYKEVAFSELFENGKLRQEYNERFFYPFGDYLMEVTKADRTFFYQPQEREKYQRKVMQETGIEIISLDAINDGSSDGKLDIAEDLTVDVELQVGAKLMTELLYQARTMLTTEENRILSEYYENGKSDQKIAQMLGSSQKNINNRRRSILAKLLKMMQKQKNIF